MLIYHVLALIIGYVLDLIVGDPHFMPHPIRAVGSWISYLEKKIYADSRLRGLLLVVLVVIPSALITLLLIVFVYKINVYLGVIVEAVLTCYFLATKSLMVESKAVVDALNNNGIVAARKSLSMIVGRDTENLSEEGILKATVETVAENSSDGVIAPLIYMAIGGPVLGIIYKACNTMDSMVGYHNDRYENFGFFAAKTDDVLNFIPSRLCAILTIIVSCILPSFDGKNAYRMWRRDRFNHKSKNSAQSESAYAGAMSIRLAGDASYFGKIVKKPYIGDDIKKIEIKDVKRSHILLYGTSILCEVLCTAVIFIIIKLHMTSL